MNWNGTTSWPETEAHCPLIPCVCSFYDRDAPIYTMSRFLPPSKVGRSVQQKGVQGCYRQGLQPESLPPMAARKDMLFVQVPSSIIRP